MNGIKVFLISIFFVAIKFSSAQSSGLEAYWKDGLKFKTADERYKFSVGGRVHYDAAVLNHSSALDSAFGEAKNKTEVRRARLSFEGSINNALAYEFEFTFGETIEYADMLVAFLRFPYFDRLTVGHFREPFGLEESTSSNDIVFMERSLTSAFGPSRNTGFMVQKEFADEKFRLYTGLFRITDDLGSDLEGEEKYSVSSRLTYNPLFDTATNKALHFGLGFNRFEPSKNIYQVKTEPETHTAPTYINTGELESVDNVTQLGAEFGYSKNKLLLQGEYIHSLAKLDKITDDINDYLRDYNSFYAMASYFLKGGIRKYKRSNNEFSTLELTEKYEEGSLSGAWEAGIRISQIKLNETTAFINKMTDVTMGLNWYFNSNSRIMMNYIFSRLNNQYSVNALQMRIQVTF